MAKITLSIGERRIFRNITLLLLIFLGIASIALLVKHTEITISAEDKPIQRTDSFESDRQVKVDDKTATSKLIVPINNSSDINNSQAAFIFNAEWKAKNIELSDGRTVAYRFGEGNPPEASPLTNEEKSAFEACGIDGRPNSITGCPVGYVTRDFELALKALISDKHWPQILSNCANEFMASDKALDVGDLHYENVIEPGYMDIEKWIVIDLFSGRKKVQRFQETKAWFITSMYDHSRTDTNGVYAIKNCISDNGGIELYALFMVAEHQLYSPI